MSGDSNGGSVPELFRNESGIPMYPATPVDCFISETRELVDEWAYRLTAGRDWENHPLKLRFENRNSQFREEVEYGL